MIITRSFSHCIIGMDELRYYKGFLSVLTEELLGEGIVY
jgi:hypothetical protein